MSYFKTSLAFYYISVLRVEFHDLGAGWTRINVLQEGLDDVVFALSLTLDLWPRVRIAMIPQMKWYVCSPCCLGCCGPNQ